MASITGGNTNEAFVKGSLVFSMMTMLLMTSFIAVFAPEVETVEGYESELNRLTEEYYDITGSSSTNEVIWGLTGIYTPVGIDADGENTNKHGTTPDGWVYGSRIESYTPTNYSGDKALDNGNESYTVTYDKNKGLYYYTAHGDNLLDITDGTVTNPSSGTLYTSVTMDTKYKSNQFFTVGSKKELENGTFYYNYSGYRYSFSSLSDYYYDKATPVSHTTSSLNLIWYRYTTDDGISGQLVLSGSDTGVAYLTGAQITRAFNAASNTSKFVMSFNGIDMNIYIHLNDYAINHGYTVEDCYNQGYWSILVTSPSVTSDSGLDGPMDNFDIDRVFEVVIDLLTFNTDQYGLTGVGGTIASTVFTMSLYTSMLAIGLSFWPVLIIMAIMGIVQSLVVADWWPL